MSNLSTEESIARLKAEIIAQDWRISPKRTEMIKAALHCLQEHFEGRKATQAMLIMALNVLDLIRRKGSNPPETVDFLKEAMAHLVELYEDLEYSPSREDKIFRSLFAHFTKLKELIKTGKKPLPKKPAPSALAAGLPSKPEVPVRQFDPPSPTDAVRQTDRTNLLESAEAEQLIRDLRNSLEKAGEVGSTIGDLLGQLIASQRIKEVARQTPQTESFPQQTAPVIQEREHKSPAQEIRDQSLSSAGLQSLIKSCPPTELRQFAIGPLKLAVQETLIAAIKPARPSKMQEYLKKSHVPAKDFSSFLKGLPSQFKGSLSRLKSKKLKKIQFPIMVPQGIDLPDTPDTNARNLLVLSNGSWHGIILCGQVEPLPQSMIQFHKKQNGDIAGTGYLENDKEILLLDSLSILRREGFLVTPG